MTRPSPRPVSLVVVKGMKSCSRTSGGDARPVVGDRDRRPSPRLARDARCRSIGRLASRTASRAFWSRLTRICSSRMRPAVTATSGATGARRTVTPASRMRPASNASAPSIAAPAATGRISPEPRRAKPRSAWVIAADPLGDADDLAEVPARVAGLAGVEQPPAGLGIGADRRERLVDLVGDAGRDLAEDRQAVGLGELVAQPPHPRLGGLALGDLGGEGGVGALQLIGPQADAALEVGVQRGERRLPGDRPAPAAQQRIADAGDQQSGEERRDLRRADRRSDGRRGGKEGGQRPARRRGPDRPRGEHEGGSRERRPARAVERRGAGRSGASSWSPWRVAASSARGRVVVKRHAGSVPARTTPSASVTWTTSPLSRQRASRSSSSTLTTTTPSGPSTLSTRRER